MSIDDDKDDDGNDEKFGKLPEVREYFATVREANRVFHRERGRSFDWNDRDVAIDKYNKARNAAWEKLGESDNELVSWIAKHERIGEVHREYAERILKVIPSPLADYDAVARRASWCEVWDGYKNEAISAGVIDVRYDFEYRYNAGNWEDLKYWGDFPRNIRNSLNKDALTKLFLNGIQDITLTCEGSFYSIRVKQSS